MSESSQAELKRIAAKVNKPSFIDHVPPEVESGRKLLQQYANLSAEEVDVHLFSIVSDISCPYNKRTPDSKCDYSAFQRERAWGVFPYGAIGRFWFLNLNPALDDSRFQSVVTRLQRPGSNETFLEVGCLLGTIIRYLATQGIRTHRLYGVDLQPGFLNIGYDLFRDKDTSQATFIAADMLERDESLAPLHGKMDIIYAANFFHLFERHDQIKAAKQMIKLLNKDNPDVLVFGKNQGIAGKDDGWKKYILDAQGWRDLWMQVGAETGTEWTTELELAVDNNWILATFAVRRA